MRKIYVDVKLRLILTVEEGSEINDILNEGDFDFIPNDENVMVEDLTVEDFDIIDSK